MKSKDLAGKPALRLRKFIFHDHVHFITCSVEEGIMLPANPLAKFIIKAAIVRAQKWHPVKISHFLVNGTHMHMIVRVDNPEDIPGFMERFKTESAHYINRLLGRKKRTIWCDGYDSPSCLDLKAVMGKIAYIYQNPVRDGLIDTVDNYPGLSSWHVYNGRQRRIFGSLISRDNLCKIDQEQGYLEFKKLSKMFAKLGSLKEIKLDPNDWLKAFGIEDEEEIAAINESILDMVKTCEEEQEGKSFMGREKLKNQGIGVPYERKVEGKKVWVICDDKEYRIEFIKFLKELASEAREVYERWCEGDTSLRMPVGVFAPRMPVLANIVGV